MSFVLIFVHSRRWLTDLLTDLRRHWILLRCYRAPTGAYTPWCKYSSYSSQCIALLFTLKLVTASRCCSPIWRRGNVLSFLTICPSKTQVWKLLSINPWWTPPVKSLTFGYISVANGSYPPFFIVTDWLTKSSSPLEQGAYRRLSSLAFKLFRYHYAF